MPFKDYFPGITWLGKRLSSRTPRGIILSILALFLGLNLLLRASSAISTHHILEIMGSLSQLTAGKTTDREVLNIFARTHSRVISDPSCAAEECKLLVLSNCDRPVLWLLTSKAPFHRVAYFLGYRPYRFDAFFRFQKNTLTSSGYRLIVDDGSLGYPGAVVINVSARAESGNSVHHSVSTEQDENPEYQVGTPRKGEGVIVSYSSAASSDLIRHAFDLKLGCLMTFRGCREFRQILPDVWQDQVNIKAAKEARLHSPEPCPQRIVRNLANNATHIYKLQVLDITKSGSHGENDARSYANFQLIEALREDADHSAVNGESGEKPSFSELPIPETANSWISKGQLVILFYERDRYWGSPCTMVPADQGNVGTVMSTISQGSESRPAQQTQIEKH